MQDEEWKEKFDKLPTFTKRIGTGQLGVVEEVYVLINKQYISNILQKERDSMRQKMMKMITDEIVICHTEGTPTARLTSLYMKLSTLSEIEI